MTDFLTLRSFVVACAVALALPLYAATPKRTGTTIAPGITLRQEVIRDSTRGGPLTVTVLCISAHRTRNIHAALAQDRIWGDDPTHGREIVSRYVARHQPDVLAAINASFFGTAGNPLGLHVQNGEMVTEASNDRSVFCLMKNGKPTIERFRFSGSVTANSATVSLDGMNRKAGKGNELLVFTPRFGRSTLHSPGRVEVILERVSQSVTPQCTFFAPVKRMTVGGATPLVKNTIVLSGGGSAARFLRRVASAKSKVTVRLSTRAIGNDRFAADRIRDAVAGGPRIVTKGRVTVTYAVEGIQANFATRRHPRSAVGIAPNGDVLLFTVDGRQPDVSRGVSLKELARILLKWGVYEGVNLDGGGSSAFVVRGLLVNAPADGRERSVANFLTVEGAPLRAITKNRKRNFRLPRRPLHVGETWTFVSSYNKSEDGVWGLPGGRSVVGFVSQQGVFQAVRPGSASVSWIPNRGRAFILPVIVMPRKASVQSAPRNVRKTNARPR